MSTPELIRRLTLDRALALRYENPVVTKELRTRMRGAKAHWTMLAYILVLGICLLFAYDEWASHAGTYDPQAWLQARIGFRLFNVLTWAQAILIALIAPSLTAGMITLEREQQTIEMLSLTTLSARNIIAGKATSAMLFILMLLASSLPLAGICLMFGSISPAEIAVTYLMLVGWSFVFVSIGTLFSALLKRTSGASLAAFGCTAMYAFPLTSVAFGLDYAHRYGGLPSSWRFVFSGMSACTAAADALGLAPVFGVRLPVAVVAIAFEAAIGVLLLTVAASHLPYHRAHRPALIRSLLLAISLVGIFLFLGNTAGPASPTGLTSGRDLVLVTFVALLQIVTLAIPIFSTGPVRKTVPLWRDLLLGPAYRKVFENRPPGGVWFLALWFVAGCGVALLAISMLGPLLWGPGTTAAAVGWSEFIECAVALLAAIVGMAIVGVLFSTLVSSRQVAAALTIVFIVVAWAVFPIMVAQYTSHYGYDWRQADGPLWQLGYLWPGLMLLKVGTQFNQGVDGPNLWLPASDAWIGCTTAWLAVGAAALYAASRRASRPGGVPDE